MTKKTYHLINDYHLLAYETVDSTNEEAKRLAEGGASHGAVIWAKEQTAGRGRLTRDWESKAGNLFVSILLSPKCPVADIAQLSFVSAVAAVEGLQPLLPAGGEFTCKWPNDILLGTKKMGGILLESFITIPEEGDHKGKPKQWVVVGVGMNIDSCPADTPYPATSLRDAGVELVSAKIVLGRFIEHFIEQYDIWAKDGFAPIRESWLKHAYGLGKKIEVRNGEETVKGIFAGISEKGELLVDAPKGQRYVINTGDVFFNAVKAVTTRKKPS